jgi:hypothetical protein
MRKKSQKNSSRLHRATFYVLIPLIYSFVIILLFFKRITDRELELICRYSTKIVQLDILGSHSVSSHWTER